MSIFPCFLKSRISNDLHPLFSGFNHNNIPISALLIKYMCAYE